MKPHLQELATRVSRTILSISNHTRPAGSWTPSLEQNLHRLGFRETLNPSLVSQVIDPHLLSHHSLALGFFNWASQQPGFAHNSESYKSVLKSLSLSRQFGAIHSLLKQVKTQRIGLDLSVYHSVIDSLIIGKKTHDAFLVFKELTSVTRVIGSEPCNSLLAALASDGFFEHAQKVFDEMSLKGIPFNTLGFGVFIWRVCRNADVVKVLNMLDDAMTNNSEINGSVVATLIIHGLCGASRLPEASNILDELKNRGCKPDFLTYWILGEAYQSAGSVVDREKTLKKKRKLGVAPRLHDYKEFLFALIAGRRICEAKELGEVIVRGNFPMDEDVSNVLIGSVAAIDPSSAIMFLKLMVEKERFPTLLTLRNLSRNLCKHGKLDELLEVYQLLSKHNYFDDYDRYHLRISFLCKAGMVKEAYGVLQEMKKNGFAPDVYFYNSVLEACCREDLLRPARKLWDEMFASGCGGNLKTYNILIQKFSKSNQMEEALVLYRHMLGKKVEPDITIYTSLLQGLCQESQLEAAFEVFSKCVEQDVDLAGTLLSTFILCLCKAGHFLAASKLLRGLTSDIAHPDSHVTLLKGFADAGEVPLAKQHVEWVQETSPSMLSVISSELLAFLPSSPKADPILQILQTIQELSRFNN
ncbi:pentatricopeptide repeat-containing protein At5g14080 isoform X1 [Cucurbita moschata]|uniref:Pentatricopeptide repeat-containing protein At5g14080 isoform X1 n=1 Tax=Cucurbita moschata TaxID=3662 RepID=A0A6J1FHE2_CUCMO|nr:pentatricopeptide repeat-containing protein At5g14080 isoform X1 [Cucurbita moschata]